MQIPVKTTRNVTPTSENKPNMMNREQKAVVIENTGDNSEPTKSLHLLIERLVNSEELSLLMSWYFLRKILRRGKRLNGQRFE